jgi:hypothetical protein
LAVVHLLRIKTNGIKETIFLHFVICLIDLVGVVKSSLKSSTENFLLDVFARDTITGGEILLQSEGLMYTHRAKFVSRILIACFLATSRISQAQAVLIDDFKLDQAGYSTNQVAAFDVLYDPSLLGGAREIWGGGASIPGACSECEITAKVLDGLFQVTPGNDCPGTGNLTWGLNYDLGLDLSDSPGLELEIAELTGIAWTRISIYSGPSNTVRRLDVYFDTPGTHTVRFSSFRGRIDRSQINQLVISTYLDLGEYVAFESVRSIPETSSLLIAFTALTVTIPLRFSSSRMSH